MSYEKFWLSVREFAALASGIDKELVIDGYDNAPANQMPKGAYCAVFVGEKSNYGHAAVNSTAVLDDENNQIAIMQDFVKSKRVTVQFNFYRDNARAFADNMQTCFEVEEISFFLRSNGIGISEIKAAIPLPTLKSSHYEERSSIGIIFFMSDTRTQKVGIIKEVSLEILTENQNKELK